VIVRGLGGGEGEYRKDLVIIHWAVKFIYFSINFEIPLLTAAGSGFGWYEGNVGTT
jgi:hypothetical protein